MFYMQAGSRSVSSMAARPPWILNSEMISDLLVGIVTSKRILLVFSPWSSENLEARYEENGKRMGNY